MLSREENEMLTRVGRGTPMGELMRRYWVPVVFTDQIAKPDCPPVRVRLMGEDLVAFRDTDGRVGLVDEKCPHRTASLFFGRNEECGLRCIYHGIKFDVDGNCVDVPCLPPNTASEQLETIKNDLRITAYPCVERGGVVFAYMGPAEHKPAFPDLEWTQVPADHRYATRHIQECNWLQGVEGGFDAPHLTFLHGGGGDGTRKIVPTFYEVVPMDFGFAVGTGRTPNNDVVLWNINILLMPFHKIISTVPHAAHMWMPIDDENTMLYSIDFHPSRPLNEKELERSHGFDWIHTENQPGTDIGIANKDNDYLIDRDRQKTGESYSGLKGFGVEDCAIQESMGAIADRTKEYLLAGDTAIVKLRRLFLQTLKDHQAGKPLPGMDPASYRVRSIRYEAPPGDDFNAQVHERMQAIPIAAE